LSHSEFRFQTPSSASAIENGIAADKDFKVLGGLLSADGSELSYVGATHWAAILDNVRNSTFALLWLTDSCR
jgi:hypothetical protein